MTDRAPLRLFAFRVLVISLGKAAHAMVNSLEMQAGNRFRRFERLTGWKATRGGSATARPIFCRA